MRTCILLVCVMLLCAVANADARTITRTIRTPEGKLAAGAKVTVRYFTADALLMEKQVRANAQGVVRVEVKSAPSARGYLLIDVPGSALAISTFSFFDDQGLLDFIGGGTITLAPAFTQTGTVVDSAQQPVPRAQVAVLQITDDIPLNSARPRIVTPVCRATCDTRGRFTLRGISDCTLLPAQLIAACSVDGKPLVGESAKFFFSAKQRQPQQIEVGATMALEGKVVDAAGTPVAGVLVRLVGIPGVWLQSLGAVQTDAQGIYRFPTVPKNAARIYALAAPEGYAPGVVPAYRQFGAYGDQERPPATATAPPLEVRRLSEPTKIQVLDAGTQQPLRGWLQLSVPLCAGLFDAQLGWVGRVMTTASINKDGAATLRLPPGTHTVEMHREDNGKSEATVTVPAEGVVTLTVGGEGVKRRAPHSMP